MNHMIKCPICASETTYLIKFEGIPDPFCWECVWSFIKVREKVIHHVRHNRESWSRSQEMIGTLFTKGFVDACEN
jgi:hypothetical protein